MTKTPRFDWGRTGGFASTPRSPQVAAGQRVIRSPGLRCGMRRASPWCGASRAGPAGRRCIAPLVPPPCTVPVRRRLGDGLRACPGGACDGGGLQVRRVACRLTMQGRCGAHRSGLRRCPGGHHPCRGYGVYDSPGAVACRLDPRGNVQARRSCLGAGRPGAAVIVPRSIPRAPAGTRRLPRATAAGSSRGA